MTTRETFGTPPAHEGAGDTAARPDSGESPKDTPGDDGVPRPGTPRPDGGFRDHGHGPGEDRGDIGPEYPDRPEHDEHDEQDGDDGDDSRGDGDGFVAARADHYESGWDGRPVALRADLVVALVVLVLDAVVLRFAVFLLYLHGDHYQDVVTAAPTHVHGAPLVAFGACTALMALVAAGLARLRTPVATGMQIVLAALVCLGLLAYAFDQMHRETEVPTPLSPVPAPTRYVPPCYSGSGTCPGG